MAEAAQALKVKLERKVNDGTASDQEISTLANICSCLQDRPCVQWADIVKLNAWRAPDGSAGR